MTRITTTTLAAAAATAALTFASSASASPARRATEPCAQVASLVADAISTDGAATSVPVDVALACLKSVPNKKDPAGQLIDSIQAFVQWQTTLAWLKNPPQSYGFPALDLVGRLNDIKSDSQSGKYDSEYDFQADIWSALRLAHDGHLNWAGDALGRFIFYNDLVGDVVSVSSDGTSVPKLYHYADLTNGNASALAKINDKDAADFYIQMGASYSVMQDADSQWNSQFPIYAASSRSSVFGQSLVHIVDKITIEYEDGSTREADTVAAFSAAADPGTEWSGITSGEDFYDRFCTPQTSSSSSSSSSLSASLESDLSSKKMMKRDERPVVERETHFLNKRQTSSSGSLPNYPDPVIIDDGYGVVSGYFLEGKGYDDTAVLAVSSFLPAGLESDKTIDFIVNFQSVVEEFLAACKSQGKKKLVIDLTDNGGGAIVAATDMYVQLFPDKDRFSANNMRRSDSLADIADVMDKTIGDSSWEPATSDEQSAASILAAGSLGSSLNPATGIYAVEGDQFTTIDQVVAEVKLNGDSFTQYQRSLFNVPDATYNLTGVGSRSNPAAAVFAAEDVVVLTDGTCGSSCTILSYFMIYDVGVKFVTAGGRPQTGKIQSLGGVEGSETYTWDTIAQAAAAAVTLDSDLAKGDVGTLASAYAYFRAGSPPQVNSKNAFAPFDASTPLQFKTQYANCRIFYTADMILDPTLVWERTADAAWSDADRYCVKDSQTAVGELLDDNNDDLDKAFENAKTDGDSGSAASVLGVSTLLMPVIGLVGFLML